MERREYLHHTPSVADAATGTLLLTQACMVAAPGPTRQHAGGHSYPSESAPVIMAHHHGTRNPNRRTLASGCNDERGRSGSRGNNLKPLLPWMAMAAMRALPCPPICTVPEDGDGGTRWGRGCASKGHGRH